MRIRSYSDMCRGYDSFEERYRYLELRGVVGEMTFGFDRYMNQRFYTSRQWKQVRSRVIVRDQGCDLGVEGHEVMDRIIIHHMNPMSVADLVHDEASILDPEYLITVSLKTHNAIHYGDERLLPQAFVERKPGDTRLW